MSQDAPGLSFSIHAQYYRSHAFTGGSDCAVRVWKAAEGAEQEPGNATDAEQPVTTLAASVRQYFYKLQLTVLILFS